MKDPKLPLSTFGYGRRACPGEMLAMRTLQMMVARTLWGFDILPDSNNREAFQPSEYLVIAHMPAVVPVKFEIPSTQHRDAIDTEWTEKDVDLLLSDVESRMGCD